METTKYGINGGETNELGQRCTPKQVFGKYEPWGSFTDSVSRDISKVRVSELSEEFHRTWGKIPTRFLTPATNKGLRCIGVSVPGVGPVTLDIIYNQEAEAVECE